MRRYRRKKVILRFIRVRFSKEIRPTMAQFSRAIEGWTFQRDDLVIYLFLGEEPAAFFSSRKEERTFER